MRTWSWKEGVVDRRRDHIELRYRDPEGRYWLVALLSAPTRRVFTVEFLPPAPEQPSDLPPPSGLALDPALARHAIRRELDFYLLKLGEPDPWAYARYHCGTAANVYSQVHWSFQPGKGRVGRSVSKRLANPNNPNRSV